MIKQKEMLLDVASVPEGGQGAGSYDVNMVDAAARLLAPEGSFEEPLKDSNADDGGISPKEGEKPTESTGTSQSNPVEGEEYVPSKDWDIFKGDEGFVMPEGINAENDSQLFKEHLAKKYGLNEKEVLHPLARQIQDLSASNPNLTINDLIDNTSQRFVPVDKMSADDKIAFDLTARYGAYDKDANPDGLTQEDITEYISGLSKIQKAEMATAITERINEYNNSLLSEYEQESAKRNEEVYSKVIETNNTLLKELETKLTSINNIFGIPVNQEEHKDYLEEFKNMITPDKATGRRGIDDMLSDDVTLYKLFVLAAKNGEDRILEIITKGRETAKEDILKKLKINPGYGSSKGNEGRQIDHDTAVKLLSMPDLG